jgi:hypothetical protein
VQTVGHILKYAVWLEEIDPGLLAYVIPVETGADHGERDLASRAIQLIGIFGIDGAARIVGCH